MPSGDLTGGTARPDAHRHARRAREGRARRRRVARVSRSSRARLADHLDALDALREMGAADADAHHRIALRQAIATWLGRLAPDSSADEVTHLGATRPRTELDRLGRRPCREAPPRSRCPWPVLRGGHGNQACSTPASTKRSAHLAPNLPPGSGRRARRAELSRTRDAGLISEGASKPRDPPDPLPVSQDHRARRVQIFLKTGVKNRTQLAARFGARIDGRPGDVQERRSEARPQIGRRASRSAVNYEWQHVIRNPPKPRLEDRRLRCSPSRRPRGYVNPRWPHRDGLKRTQPALHRSPDVDGSVPGCRPLTGKRSGRV